VILVYKALIDPLIHSEYLLLLPGWYLARLYVILEIMTVVFSFNFY